MPPLSVPRCQVFRGYDSAMCLKSSKQQERNYEEANRHNRAWRCRYARHSHYFIRAKRSPDRWLPVCDGRRGWQSGFCTRTSSVRSHGCRTPTSHDQAPQKDLYVSEALKEWLLTLLTQSGGPGFHNPGPFLTITGSCFSRSSGLCSPRTRRGH